MSAQSYVDSVCHSIWDSFGHQWPCNINGRITHEIFRAAMTHALATAIGDADSNDVFESAANKLRNLANRVPRPSPRGYRAEISRIAEEICALRMRNWYAEYRVAQEHAEQIDDLCVANARALFRALHPGEQYDEIEREQSHDITCEAVKRIATAAEAAGAECSFEEWWIPVAESLLYPIDGNPPSHESIARMAWDAAIVRMEDTK